jgi:MFS family permease
VAAVAAAVAASGNGNARAPGAGQRAVVTAPPHPDEWVSSGHGAHGWQPGRALVLLLAHFALFGSVIGIKGVLWAELIAALHIGEGPFGSAQLASALVSTVVVLLYARLARRTGTRPIALAGLGLLIVTQLGLAWAGSLAALVVVLALTGAASGLYDGSMTQASVDWERAARRARMNLLHAGFSSGAVAGAVTAGVALAADVDYRAILVGATVLCLVVWMATLAVRYPPTAPPAAVPGDTGGDWRAVLGLAPVRALVGIILCSIVIESVAFVWAVIYLREQLGASALIGGASFALFNATMFAGRLANTPVVARYGARASLLASGVGIGLGGLLLIVANSIPLAVAALGLIGLGVAGIFPTVMSAAAAQLPNRSGALTTVVMTVCYLAFMVTPPAIGWVAQLQSLRLALVLVPLTGLVIVALAWRLALARIVESPSPAG